MSKKIVSYTHWECDGDGCGAFTNSPELPHTWHRGVNCNLPDRHLCPECWEKVKLKPNRCQCGREHVVYLDGYGKWYVECFVGHFSTARFDTEQEAVVSWNSLLKAGRTEYQQPCPLCGQRDCPCWHKKLDAVAAQLWPPARVKVLVSVRDGGQLEYGSRQSALHDLTRLDMIGRVIEIREVGEKTNTRLFLRYLPQLVEENEP